MKLAHVTLLEDFGNRSVLIHGVMVVAFVNAVMAGLFISGQLGIVSFVALLNFTAGLWVAHTIHSLGNSISDDGYTGVINELFATDALSGDGIDTGRFGRLLTLVAAVTAISLLTSAQVLTGSIFSVAVVAIGAIAVVTAIVGFLIALGSSYDDAERRRVASVDPYDPGDDDPDVATET
ncbi:hypothetical protein [Natrarchaeobaculum aegyptiacum]|uniref:Uncharacterized protein n=1 Tax=Natrarchaeobaculum aegyptiacum TaxID=745377 RepID=A0A2Z2HTY4_9EURY|nr:hypothetical protein [Natrarchaeobaculum aegyptiacum]ARS90670.1 hypothetical protein B1756_13655 [Natrarchaeobaculum aegyptiacum]